jgi:flagellar assembly protein FliH
LSNLIKEGQKSLFQINAFRAEEIGPVEGSDDSDDESGEVRLPVGKGPSLFPHHPSGESAQDEDVVSEEDDAVEDGEAEDIVDAGKLAELEKEAYRQGFEQGQRDGLAIEEKQTAEKSRQLEHLLTELGSLKAQIVAETEREILELAVAIAKCVVNAEVKSDPAVIERTVRSASRLVVDSSQLRILINPSDMEAVKGLLPEFAAATKGSKPNIAEDPSIERGGCILETGFGRINATIESQIATLQRELEAEFHTHSDPNHAASP